MISSIKTFLRVIRNLINHPLNKERKIKTIFRFVKFNIGIRLIKSPIIYRWIGNTQLIIKQGMSGATGSIYTGLFEFEEMSFLLHLIRSEDMFYDVGANAGVYTILASGVKGARSKSFEPIPQTFENLKNNININDLNDKVSLYNIGINKKETTLNFTKSLDVTNHVISDNSAIPTININCLPLDDINTDLFPILLKIDVEGFENEVIEGARDLLLNKSLKAIIIELNGLGKRYGFDDASIHNTLTKNGFRPYQYAPFDRKLKELDTFNEKYNTIYLRDLDFIQKRINGSENIIINNISY